MRFAMPFTSAAEALPGYTKSAIIFDLIWRRIDWPTLLTNHFSVYTLVQTGAGRPAYVHLEVLRAVEVQTSDQRAARSSLV